MGFISGDLSAILAARFPFFDVSSYLLPSLAYPSPSAAAWSASSCLQSRKWQRSASRCAVHCPTGWSKSRSARLLNTCSPYLMGSLSMVSVLGYHAGLICINASQVVGSDSSHGFANLHPSTEDNVKEAFVSILDRLMYWFFSVSMRCSGCFARDNDDHHSSEPLVVCNRSNALSSNCRPFTDPPNRTTVHHTLPASMWGAIKQASIPARLV